MSRYLDVADVADRLDVAPSTIRDAIASGKLRAETVAGKYELCLLDLSGRLIVRGRFRKAEFTNPAHVVNVDPDYSHTAGEPIPDWPLAPDDSVQQVIRLEQELAGLEQRLDEEKQKSLQREQLAESRIQTLKEQLTRERRFVAIRHKQTLRLMADSVNIVPGLSPEEESDYRDWTRELPGIDF